MKQIFVILYLLILPLANAEKTGLKIEDINSDKDTSITIKKGAAHEGIEYEIIDGHEPIGGSPEFDRSKAYASWKVACGEWKTSMKELNKQNSLITLNCGSPVPSKEESMVTYKSEGSYKLKVLIRNKVK